VPVLANAERVSDGDSFIIHCVFMQVHERRKYEQEILKAKRDAEDALKQNRQLVELANSMELQAIQLERQYRNQIEANENFLQFGKIVSHDLQEPIRKIQIFADIILRDTQSALTARSKNYVNKIIMSGEKLKVLTNSLHQYISIDSDKTVSSVDLNDVIRSASEKAKNSRHFFDLEIEIDKMPHIEGYATQLELMFFHLIDNAIQFRSPNRKLSLKVGCLVLEQNIFRATKDRYKYVEHVRISFSDNGIGFSEEYRDYVFELLKKGDNSSKGLGLGLSLVKKVANNHSGAVHIDSQPGIGTRIEIEIPSKKASM
jgi:sigma-B regulation protein RsbU (phosphoserine phosphatase)